MKANSPITQFLSAITLILTILCIFAVLSAAAPLTFESAAAVRRVAIAPNLGVARRFSVLGGSGVSNTGPSILNANLGSSPGSAITGFPPGIVLGTIHAADPVATQAQSDAGDAYNFLAGQGCDTDLSGQDLGGLTLTPGVYCFDSSAQLSGILTLDAQGDPNAVFVFKILTNLAATSNSAVVTINSASFCSTFFQVGGSATIGTSTIFQGTILAFDDITLTTGVSLNGRALAQNGQVTLDSNFVATAACAPTSAAVIVGGRVTDANGRGLSNVTIRMTTGEGLPIRQALSSPFGYYAFDNVQAGGAIVLDARHKRYRFVEPIILLSVSEDATSANFVTY